MINNRRGPIPSELDWLIDTLDGYEERLRTLEAPSGEALGSTVAKLSALVANIEATLADFIANDVQAIVDARVAAVLAGNVAIGGTLYVAGKVTMPGVYALNVVPGGRPRTAVWVDSIGEVGHT